MIYQQSLRWNYLEQVFIPFFLRDVDVYQRPLPQAQRQVLARGFTLFHEPHGQDQRGTFLQYNQAR